jgi:hypothetical protein
VYSPPGRRRYIFHIYKDESITYIGKIWEEWKEERNAEDIEDTITGTWLIYERDGVPCTPSADRAFRFYEDNYFTYGQRGSGDYQSGRYKIADGKVTFSDHYRTATFIDGNHALFIDNSGYTQKAVRVDAEDKY